MIQEIEIEKVKRSLIELVNGSLGKPIYIPGTNDVRDPFYRTNSRVSAETNDRKVLKLNARFYFNG